MKIGNIRSLIQRILLPLKIIKRNIKRKWIYKKITKKHHQLLLSIKDKPKVKVVFLVLFKSMWKLDLVFKNMLDDPYFEPVILIIPNTVAEESDRRKEYKEAYDYFKKKNFPVFGSYILKEDRWLDLSELSPDIVFFTNPHNLTINKYYEDAFYNYLTCYAGYGINTSKNVEVQYNKNFHSTIWNIFVQTKDMKLGYRKNCPRKDINVHLVVDNIVKSIQDNLYSVPKKSVWKNNKLYKIIIAPHHRISENDLLTATFLKYADFFIDLAKATENSICWSFKPHPHLKSKLYRMDGWGEERTDNYYDFWNKSINTQLDEGDYVDLFLESDAMILDSYSFLAEYTFTEKPMLYLLKDGVEDLMSDFGLKCLSTHYKAYTKEEILIFVENLKNKKDFNLPKRKELIEDYYFDLNGNEDSKFVLEVIKSQINEAK